MKAQNINPNLTREQMRLAPPWVNYASEVESLFADDPEVTIVYDDEKKKIKVYVDNVQKYYALDRLMLKEKEFGNIVITVEVIPANVTESEGDTEQLFNDAFRGNPAFRLYQEVTSPFGVFRYAIFNKDVAQFQADNIGSLYGVKTMLYEEIAEDVLDTKYASFCTELVEEQVDE